MTWIRSTALAILTCALGITNACSSREPQLAVAEWMVVEESVIPFSPQGMTGLGSADLDGLVLEGTETLDGVPAYHLVGTVPSEALGLTPPGIDVDLGGELQIDAVPGQGTRVCLTWALGHQGGASRALSLPVMARQGAEL